MALKMEEGTIKECYIRDLQPGMLDWRITVRVTSKSRIIPPNKERQRTLLFVDFLDKSGEIRAVALIENLCVKYYPLFEVNNVYMLSNLEVKNKFSNQPPVIKNQYELHFQRNTEVFHCNEVPQIPYNFTLTISEILNKNLIEMGENSIERFIDVIGVLVGADEHCESKVEKGAIESTRNIVLRDRTGEITVHLRGKYAEDFNLPENPNPVVVIKRGYLSQYSEFTNLYFSNEGSQSNLILADCYMMEPNISDTLTNWYKMPKNETYSGLVTGFLGPCN